MFHDDKPAAARGGPPRDGMSLAQARAQGRSRGGGAGGWGSQDTVGGGVTQKSIQALLQSACVSGVMKVANRDLVELPKELFSLDQLQYDGKRWWEEQELHTLDCSHNRLTAMPHGEEIAPHLQDSMRTVIVSYNRIGPQLDCVSVFLNLVRLDVSHNNLQGPLSTALGFTQQTPLSTLVHLKDIDVSHNEVTVLDGGVSMLPQLTTLQATHNKIAAIEDAGASGGQGPVSSGFGHQGPADGRGRGFHQQQQSQAQAPGGGAFPSLQVLNLASNVLQSLPAALGQCAQLTHLDVSCNRLQAVDAASLPRHICVLNVRQNALVSLPSPMAAPKLKELICGNNQLRVLPDLTPCAATLAFVDCSSNKIADATPLCVLTELSRADLQNNDLPTLPPELSLLRKLTSVVVDGNPMRGIRRDIVARGTVQLLKYLRTRLDEARNDDVVASADDRLAAVAASVQRRPGSAATPPDARTPTSPAPPSSGFGYAQATPTPARRGGPNVPSTPPTAGSASRSGPDSGLMVLGARNGTVWDLSYTQPTPVAGRRAMGGLRPTSGGVGSRSGDGGTGAAPLLPETVDVAFVDAAAPATLHAVQGCTALKLQGQRQLMVIAADVLHATGCAETLTDVDVSGTSVGADLGRQLFAVCPNLTSVIAAKSGLGAFAEQWPELLGCRGLLRIDLSQNPQLSSLPESFSRLTRLTHVTLNHCRMPRFPMALTMMLHLTELQMASCGLGDFLSAGSDGSGGARPDQCWPRLQLLDLSGNDLQTVPFTLGLMGGTLRSLRLEGNRIRWLRPAVLDKGTVAVLQYLKDKIPS